MSTTGAPLRSWASLLGFLESDLAIAVEAMARSLTLVMDEITHPHAGRGEPDGFGGIAPRGDLDRLLLSEWMLAAEEPHEFIRRVAMGELSYLRRERIEPRTSTRLVLLMDVGPDQLGAPRLVYLAGLVVLHRRAEAMGVELALGLLGDEPGAFVCGELPEQFAAWRRSRSAIRPTVDQLGGWLDCLDPSDHCWIFGVETLSQAGAMRLGQHLRRLSASELEWAESGATSMAVVVDGRQLRLPLLDSARAVALLRGRGTLRMPEISIGHGRSVRFPRFTGHARRLLSRGDGPSELVTISLPPGRSGDSRRWHRHHVKGRILAAAVIGPRTVALVADERSIRVAVIGKRLGRVALIDLTPAQLELDERAIVAISDSDLEPLFYAPSSHLIVRLADKWWLIEPPDKVTKSEFVAVAVSSTEIHRPRIAYLVSGRIHLLRGGGIQLPPDRRVFFGPLDATAYESAVGEFTITGQWAEPQTIRVPVDSRIVGVTATREDGPSMVVQSPGERLIRLVGPERSRTLTLASGDVVDVSLHPTEPILAIQRRDGTVEAVELPDGAPLTVMLADEV